MSDSLVAKRYAKALFDLSSSDGVLDRTDSDMHLIDGTLSGSPELVHMFESPVVSRAKKETVTRELFGSKINSVTQDFLSMLIAKRRENIFQAVVRSYRELRNEQMGIVEASAKSAKPLSEDEQQKLQRSLEQMTGKQIRLTVETDASLIGGISVKIGDTVHDSSVRHQLEGLRETFRAHSSSKLN